MTNGAGAVMKNVASETIATQSVATQSIVTESVATSNIATASPPKLLKCTRTELILPTPAKRIKTEDQGLLSFVKVAVVPMDYPERKLDADEVALIMRLIKLRIFDLADDTKAPTFIATSEQDGTVVFNCTDEETGEWLESYTSEIIVKEGVQVYTLPADDLFRCHRVVVHVGDPKMSVKEMLEFLNRQNEGLATSEWIVMPSSRDAANSHFVALIDDCSLEALQALNFKPFCGLGQATVKFLGKERKRENLSSG